MGLILPEIQELSSLLDDETFSHCNNVKNSIIKISKKTDTNIDKEILCNAAAVLDIGKILINEYVFHKAELLSETERELMDLHPYLGYRILKENQIPDKIAEIVLYHHGRDRPCLGSVPEFCPQMEKNIKAIHTVDTFEALREERGYRNSYHPVEAYELMKESEEEYSMEILEFLYRAEI